MESFHPGLVAGFLTDHTVPKSGAPFQSIKSMDQYIADALQGKTRLRDLVMTSSMDSPGEQAQSGVYGSNISWISPTTPAGSIKAFNNVPLAALHYTIMKKMGVNVTSYSGVSQLLNV